MGYIHKTILVEDGDWVEMKQTIPIGSSISREIRHFMQNYNMSKKGDIDAVNRELLAIEINNLRNQKNKIDSSLKAKEDIMREIIQRAVEKDKEKLEMEKKMVEKKKTCFQCGLVKEEGYPFHKFGKNNICRGCFLGATQEQIKKWNKI